MTLAPELNSLDGLRANADRGAPDRGAPDLQLPECHNESSAIVRDIFNRVGDKWTLLVIRMLDGTPQRFTALRNAVPRISQRMLTLTLRQLERDGLVSRTVFGEVPPRVEYALTHLGQTIVPHIVALATWAIDHEGEIRDNRDMFDELADA